MDCVPRRRNRPALDTPRPDEDDEDVAEEDEEVPGRPAVRTAVRTRAEEEGGPSRGEGAEDDEEEPGRANPVRGRPEEVCGRKRGLLLFTKEELF